MDTVRFNSVGSRLFSSFCSSTFIFLSSFLQLIAAEEECKAYYDLNGRSFHDSFSCPVYCCGNAFVKYCCDDPAKRNNVKHYDTLSMPDWFVMFVLGLMVCGMLFTCIYTFCFVFRGDNRISSRRSSTVSRGSTTATAISIEHIGEEHGPNSETTVAASPSISSHLPSVAPPYSQPSAEPPPYFCELPPTYKP